MPLCILFEVSSVNHLFIILDVLKPPWLLQNTTLEYHLPLFESNHTYDLGNQTFIPLLYFSQFTVWNLPSRAAIICSMEGSAWFLSKAYMDITIPGVQKPHWEPWHLASLSWKETPQIALLPVYITILMNSLLNRRHHTKCCFHSKSDFLSKTI